MAKEYRDKLNEFNISNQLIEAKYVLSPFAKDIMNLAITRMETTDNKDAPLQALIYNSELYKLYGNNKKSNISRDLDRVKDEIQACKIVIDDGKGGFDSYIIAPTCSYHNGVFGIEFNKNIRKHTLILDNTTYTKLNLVSTSMLGKFYTKRIYELLKEDYYRLNPKSINNYITKVINVSEFRFMIGLADPKEPKVDSYIKKCKRSDSIIDWDYAFSLVENVQYKRWADIKTRIIEPAQAEINKYTEIKFDFIENKGAHGKVLTVDFKIYKNEPEPDIIDERQRKMRLIEEKESEFYKQQDISDYLCRNLEVQFSDHSDKFGMDEIKLFMADACNDEELVRWAVQDTDNYAENNVVSNYIGAVRDRIKKPEAYSNQKMVVEGHIVDEKIITEAKEVYKENKTETALNVWEKVKAKDEFADFVSYLENSSNHLTIEMFESLYSPEEYFGVYSEWKKGQYQ